MVKAKVLQEVPEGKETTGCVSDCDLLCVNELGYAWESDEQLSRDIIPDRALNRIGQSYECSSVVTCRNDSALSRYFYSSSFIES